MCSQVLSLDLCLVSPPSKAYTITAVTTSFPGSSRLSIWRRVGGSRDQNLSIEDGQLEALKSLHWVACGIHYTKKEVTELGGIELQRFS